MGETIINQAFSLSDSVFLVLLLAVALGMWRLVLYVLRKNDERENRYIVIIATQADGLKGVEDVRQDVRDLKDILKRRGGNAS